ncbi:MAG: MarR family winged helix-turn-helix transcriptional regulator [Myxococcota bacterium]
MSEPPRTPADVAADITSHCLAMRVRMIERAFTKRYTEVTAQHGATVAQMTLLAAITRVPGVRAADLSSRLILDASTLSRNLDRLERMGWIEVRKGEGRNRHLFVTSQGEAILLAIDDGWRAVQAEMHALLGEQADAVASIAQAVQDR